MPDYKYESNNAGNALQRITPVPFNVIPVQVRLGLIGYVQTIYPMVQQRKPYTEQFQEEDERQAVQPKYTVSETGSATLHSRKIRHHVLNEKSTKRYNA